MGKPESNPYRTTSDLISNAIGTARVFGENRRITNLVASTVGRLILEMDGSGEGDKLLAHALSCINAQDAEHVPTLYSALNALSVLIE